MSKLVFQCIELDDENQRINIRIGDTGFVDYKDIAKLSVLNEDAKWKGKSEPFAHQILGGTTFISGAVEPRLFVGLKIVLKDHSVKAVYISERKTGINTDIYREDTKEAHKIKKLLDERIVV